MQEHPQQTSNKNKKKKLKLLLVPFTFDLCLYIFFCFSSSIKLINTIVYSMYTYARIVDHTTSKVAIGVSQMSVPINLDNMSKLYTRETNLFQIVLIYSIMIGSSSVTLQLKRHDKATPL